MLPSLKEILSHICEEMEFILQETATKNYDEFLNDRTLKRAVVRSFEIIGEASKIIPNDFRSEHPEIDWKGMAGLRDKLIHHYFGIDYELVWDIIIDELPTQFEFIKHLLN
ncbi:MAG: hypothetical protein RL065_769 [Bacteroidota bacterium]|jgi:uncharacterized protein with HEPN domain